MFYGLNWLFGSKDDETSLNDNIVPENDYYEAPKELPHDYDEYQWWNIFDWAGHYDKSLEAYNQRKNSENAQQNRIFFYIVAGLFGIYLIRR